MIREKKKYIENTISPEIKSKIEYVRGTTSFEDLYTALSKSIAPEIYGHEDVKKALILLMGDI
jgi:DNA replication licensing factor MCM7